MDYRVLPHINFNSRLSALGGLSFNNGIGRNRSRKNFKIIKYWKKLQVSLIPRMYYSIYLSHHLITYKFGYLPQRHYTTNLKSNIL